MIIKSIELSNFRNYEHLDITFDEGTNILYGDNAQERQISWKLPMSVERQSHTRAAGIKR